MNTDKSTGQQISPLLTKRIMLLGWVMLSVCQTACTVMPPQTLSHSPQFEPVYPIRKMEATSATGAIYVGRQSDSWFGKGRNFQVGDVITV